MQEYQNEYIPAYKAIRTKRERFDFQEDSIRNVYQGKVPQDIKAKLAMELQSYYDESDATLLAYVREHPDSFLALWKFIDLFANFGYEPIFDAITQSFSDSLQSTYAGKVLTSAIKAASTLQKGAKFPLVQAIDSLGNPLDRSLFKENHYTLIDFWYSNCGPCVAQFPDLRNLYETYHNKGFEIVGISTDKTDYHTRWLTAIHKYEAI